jgi:energy-coupling factor transporter ATP-binding protein EcfA2
MEAAGSSEYPKKPVKPTGDVPVQTPGQTARAAGSEKISPSMFVVMESQVKEMRAWLTKYKVCGVTSASEELAYGQTLPQHADILIFGPSGSGKSSLIRTFYMALHQTTAIPKALADKIVVKDTNLNEGTLKYLSAVIKGRDPHGRTSAIICHDTRGHIWMDKKEQKQLDVMMEGKVQDDTVVAQRNFRYARLLWEFWKADADLFPQEILSKRAGMATKPHALIFVFDGSMEDIPNGEEETEFYKEIIQMARDKGYFYPQVVLTRIDKVETQIPPQTDPAEAELRLRQLLDQKIETVVLKLGISRASVHFVENYHGSYNEASNNISIDFHALRILHECCQHADTFIRQQMSKRKTYCTVQ